MKRQLTVFFSLIFLAVFGFTASSFAASSPVPMLEKTANQLISKLQQNKSQLRKNPSIINGFVKSIILPHVAETEMARSVVSRSNWANATASQRQQFVEQFRTLVIRTYAAAFSSYTNESVKFRPLRPAQLSSNYLTVSSIVIRPGKPSIPVSYAVSQQQGQWKITDFTVDGISMVNSFKSQFASLDTSKGLAGLTTTLKKHNNKS